MHKLLLMMIFMIAFTGCDFIKEKVEYFQETIEGMNKKQSLFKKVIKDNYGLDSKIEWEIAKSLSQSVKPFLGSVFLVGVGRGSGCMVWSVSHTLC